MSKIQELKIIMVAPRGVGKTSLLAAMHEEFDKTFERSGLDAWTTDSKTLDAIEECKGVLKNIDPRLREKRVTPTSPSVDPWNDEGFTFDIGSEGKKFMNLRFTDPSGEYFNLKAKDAQQEFVRRQLRECDAVIIPIDATALMEKKTGRVNGTEVGSWHEEKNASERITGLLKDAYESLDAPRLVILAPIKCETYVTKPKDAEKLLDHVKMGYRQLLDFLRSGTLYNKVAVVVTPVQTIGNTVFAYWEPDKEQPGYTKFEYYKCPINAPYAPQDGDQPLRYVLRFLLNVYNERKKEQLLKSREELSKAKAEFSEVESLWKRRNELWLPIRVIFNFFDDRETTYNVARNRVDGLEEEVEATEAQIQTFNTVIYNFAVRCKEEGGFAILQGRAKWLSIPKLG